MEVVKIVLIVLGVIVSLLVVMIVLYKLGIITVAFAIKCNTKRRKQAEKLGTDEEHKEVYIEGKRVLVIKKDNDVIRISVSDDKETHSFGCKDGNIVSFYNKGKEIEYESVCSVDKTETVEEKSVFLQQINDVDKILKEMTKITDGENLQSEEKSTVPNTYRIKDKKGLMLVHSSMEELLKGANDKNRTLDIIEDKKVKKVFSDIDDLLENAGAFQTLVREYLNNSAAGPFEISSILGLGSNNSVYKRDTEVAHVECVAMLSGTKAARAVFLGSVAFPVFALGYGLHTIIKKKTGDDNADIKIGIINNLSQLRKKKDEVEMEIESVLLKTKDPQNDKRYRYLVDWLVAYDSLVRINLSE